MTFCVVGAETVIDLSVGVERLIEGRLKAAGSMSGMLDERLGYGDSKFNGY